MAGGSRRRAPQYGGDGFEQHRARRRFGQNFLVDETVIQRIVDAVAPVPGDRVVEIGPGRGALTALLLETGCKLTVVEIDRDLASGLRRRFSELHIEEGDVLRIDLASLAPRPMRVVGNLPYNISTPLLFRLLAVADHVVDAHFMLQDEVVQRLAAGPGEKAWGRLGVMVQYRCEVEALFAVGADAFTPRPQVRSRIVRLVPRARPVVAAQDEALFEAVVRAAFSQRRKTLRNGLKTLPDLPESAWDALAGAGVDLRARPETLSVEDFVSLSNVLAPLFAEGR